MGGDHGPAVTVEACLLCLARHPDLHLVLAGEQAVIRRLLLTRTDFDPTRIVVRHASEVVAMDDKPSTALRSKKDSSMRVALNMVRDGEADACVSAGNTGALMALGRYVLKTFAGIDRPAIIASIPTRKGHSHVLDLGANVDCDARHLFQFALMGTELARAVDGLDSPRVALLNVGEEEVKGNEQVREAARQIHASGAINYVGFIEGNDIFTGVADVIVCDGFVGNVTLKAIEELLRMIGEVMREVLGRNLLTRILGGMVRPVLGMLRKRMDPAENNGASLLGLRGIVVKSHGSADPESFAHAIETAMLEVERNVPELISQRLEELLPSDQGSTP